MAYRTMEPGVLKRHVYECTMLDRWPVLNISSLELSSDPRQINCQFYNLGPNQPKQPLWSKISKIDFAENCSVTSTAGYKPVKSSLSSIKTCIVV